MKQPLQLILASQSPQRRQLLSEAGYEFLVRAPSGSAECGICSRETPPEMVARLARQKAADVADQFNQATIIGCDTVAECMGTTLGKPANQQHAREMLQLVRGRKHSVYSGLCIWQRPGNQVNIQVEVTSLYMEPFSDAELDEYLQSGQWEGKSGAFGLQDRTGWLKVLSGSESNVIGLPLELLERMLSGTNGMNDD